MDQKTIPGLANWHYLEDQVQDEDIRSSALFWKVDPKLVIPRIIQCPIITIADGSALITPEKDNDNIFLLLTGNLTIHLEDPKSPPIRIVRPGGTVGELSLISNTQTTAYVLAKGMPRILVINEKLLWQMIDDIAPIAQNLLYVLCGWIISGNQRVIDDRHRIEKLQEVADKDRLTNLHNRRSFDEALSRLLSFCARKKYPLTLIFMDVDHFKKFNDDHGHLAGDQALAAVARALIETIRPGDVVARYGGEEFVAILPDATIKKGMIVAERLRVAVANKKFTMPDGATLPQVTLSLGIAESTPDSTPAALIKAADKKLYEAKQAGRNRCCG